MYTLTLRPKRLFVLMRAVAANVQKIEPLLNEPEKNNATTTNMNANVSQFVHVFFHY